MDNHRISFGLLFEPTQSRRLKPYTPGECEIGTTL